jgi:hypothetical protein
VSSDVSFVCDFLLLLVVCSLFVLCWFFGATTTLHRHTATTHCTTLQQDRIQRQYKLPNATLGKMSVSFRESIASGKSVGKAEEDRMVGTKRRFAKMSIAVEPLSFSSAGSDAQDTQDAQRIMHNEIDLSSISPHDDDDDEGGGEERGASRVQLQASQCDAVRESIEQVLASGGPVAGYPVAGVRVTVLAQDCAFDEDSTPVAVASCAARAVRRALENGAMELLEPGKTTPTIVSLTIVFFGHCFFDHCFFDHCFFDHCFFDHCFFDHCFFDHCFFDHCFFDHCFFDHCFFGHCFFDHCFFDHCFFSPCTAGLSLFDH